jgi:hypothetical protein
MPKKKKLCGGVDKITASCFTQYHGDNAIVTSWKIRLNTKYLSCFITSEPHKLLKDMKKRN